MWACSSTRVAATVEYDVTTAAGASDLVFDETPVPYTPQIVYEDQTK